MNISLVTLDLKGQDINEIKKVLQNRLIFTKLNNNELNAPAQIAEKAQTIIDEMAARMPDLLPVQFHFMLNKYGFDDAIASLLPALKTEDINKYAMYKAYLEQARFYEFEKTLMMFNDIRAKFVAVDESLDFTLEQLRAMWLEASQV